MCTWRSTHIVGLRQRDPATRPHTSASQRPLPLHEDALRAAALLGLANRTHCSECRVSLAIGGVYRKVFHSPHAHSGSTAHRLESPSMTASLKGDGDCQRHDGKRLPRCPVPLHYTVGLQQGAAVRVGPHILRQQHRPRSIVRQVPRDEVAVPRHGQQRRPCAGGTRTQRRRRLPGLARNPTHGCRRGCPPR